MEFSLLMSLTSLPFATSDHVSQCNQLIPYHIGRVVLCDIISVSTSQYFVGCRKFENGMH